jgi:hypothetical protein
VYIKKHSIGHQFPEIVNPLIERFSTKTEKTDIVAVPKTVSLLTEKYIIASMSQRLSE